MKTKRKRRPVRKPEPVTPDLISEVRAALDARRAADSALLDLLCRVYKNPFHWRIPDDYFKAALKWLNRHDPEVKFLARVRTAMAKSVTRAIDDAIINGDPSKRATKAHAARPRSKARSRVPKGVQTGENARTAKRRKHDRERKAIWRYKEWASRFGSAEP